VVRAKKTSYEIVVNEKTMSEVNTALLPEQLKLVPYVDKAMTAVLVLDKPDLLKPGDTGLSLIKKMKCS
jgi:hypothetical protein